MRGGSLSHRMTQRNLRATLELVDLRQPSESPLLVAPRQLHGGLETPVLGELDRAPYEQLAAWVSLLTRKHARRAREQRASWWTNASTEGAADSGGRRHDFVGQWTNSPEARALFGGAPDADAANAAARPSAAPATQPDPFDPEVFNQRYLTPPRNGP
jgi:hypothetical protein